MEKRRAKPNPSSHVIDLRQAGGTAAPVKPAPVRPARPKAVAVPKRRVPSAPVAPVEQAPAQAPTKSSVQAPPSVAPQNDMFADSLPAPRRFWPAFWRFLILLIILGFLITGAVYLYFQYHQS